MTLDSLQFDSLHSKPEAITWEHHHLTAVKPANTATYKLVLLAFVPGTVG